MFWFIHLFLPSKGESGQTETLRWTYTYGEMKENERFRVQCMMVKNIVSSRKTSPERRKRYPCSIVSQMDHKPTQNQTNNPTQRVRGIDLCVSAGTIIRRLHMLRAMRSLSWKMEHWEFCSDNTNVIEIFPFVSKLSVL